MESDDVVLGELKRAETSVAARTSSMDTKAGLVLASAGILVGLTSDRPTWLQAGAQALAALSGALAIAVLMPSRTYAVSPAALLVRHHSQRHGVDPEVVRDTRIAIYELNERHLVRKLLLFRGSLVALGVSVLVAVVASVVLAA